MYVVHGIPVRYLQINFVPCPWAGSTVAASYSYCNQRRLHSEKKGSVLFFVLFFFDQKRMRNKQFFCDGFTMLQSDSIS